VNRSVYLHTPSYLKQVVAYLFVEFHRMRIFWFRL